MPHQFFKFLLVIQWPCLFHIGPTKYSRLPICFLYRKGRGTSELHHVSTAAVGKLGKVPELFRAGGCVHKSRPRAQESFDLLQNKRRWYELNKRNLEHFSSSDPLGRPIIMGGSDNYFHTCLPSVFPSVCLSNHPHFSKFRFQRYIIFSKQNLDFLPSRNRLVGNQIL